MTEAEWVACTDPAEMCCFIWPTPAHASYPGIDRKDLRRKQLLYFDCGPCLIGPK